MESLEGSAMEPVAASAEEPAFAEASAGGGDNAIYQGILWMKEKYEQYREQADRRYEQLRAELGRSEERYQLLLASMERQKKDALQAATGVYTGNGPAEAGPVSRELPGEMRSGEGEILPDGDAEAGGEAGSGSAELTEARSQLDAQQVLIGELEEQLRVEKLKVEELVIKLQSNSELLIAISRELDKSIQAGKPAL